MQMHHMLWYQKSKCSVRLSLRYATYLIIRVPLLQQDQASTSSKLLASMQGLEEATINYGDFFWDNSESAGKEKALPSFLGYDPDLDG